MKLIIFIHSFIACCVCHLDRLFLETEAKNKLKGADKGALDYYDVT